MEPHYNHAPDPETPTRRKVLGVLIGLINAGLAAAIAIPAFAFLLDPLRHKRGEGNWIDILGDADLAEGETKYVSFEMLVEDGYMQSVRKASVYVNRKGKKIVAYDPSCPHLGCHVEYKAARDRYICPCHGGVFSSDGERVSGPPPRGHHYGSSFIVIAIVLHILRTFFWGTYKKPRELTWVLGVFIFAIMLAFSFTGYLLPWDQKAFWATVVGTRMVETVPLVGPLLLVLVPGGEEVGALTLTRFYAIHIMALPAALIGLTAGHLYLVRRLHISGPVTKQKGKPVKFYPTQLFRDAIVLLVAIGWLLLLAYLAKPELGPVANPARVDFTPKGASVLTRMTLAHLHAQPCDLGWA